MSMEHAVKHTFICLKERIMIGELSFNRAIHFNTQTAWEPGNTTSPGWCGEVPRY